MVRVQDRLRAGQPGRGSAVDQRSIIVRVYHVEPQSAKKPGQPHDQARPQASRFVHGRDCPAGVLQRVSKRAASAQRDEVQIEVVAVGVAGELDEQFFLAAYLQALSHMADTQTPDGW